MAYVIKATNNVAKTTPLALYSKSFCSNKKKTPKLGKAPNASNIHKFPCCTKPLKVEKKSEDFKLDIINVQIITPKKAVTTPIKKPLNTSCLIFKIPRV